ncbi:GRAM domain containing [Cyanidiococcus yangmingshanensis]|uniref:GRAM domain containing n=1 Tax=Cyanidiococcus yangmingshanensis TaxID=2690220 RepID=A0A7J7INE1_9RHOD|nr:GRAM domain containing [Cyanidiococcus yangmingshanensis]
MNMIRIAAQARQRHPAQLHGDQPIRPLPVGTRRQPPSRKRWRSVLAAIFWPFNPSSDIKIWSSASGILDRELGFVREFRYRKPLEPAPMSPKETWMTEHMMFYVTGHEQDKLQTIFLEIQGTSHDVPFGDSFVAEQLYIFRPAQENSRFECELEVYAGAHFHHWSMVAGTIRKRTIAGVEKTANIFVQMARELCTTSLCRRLRERERAQYEAGITEPVTPQPAEVTPDVIEETTVPSSVVETKLEPITFEALPLPTRYVLLPFYRLSVMASSAAYWDATLLNAFTILCMTLLSFWVFRLHISNQQLIAELRRADEQLHFLRDVLADRLRN